MTFCSHSTDESIQNEQISILAIFEIFIFIAIYWGIASYFDYYYHIYFSLAVAPLFLLRTQKSEKEALEFFVHFLDEKEKSFAKYLLISFILLCVVVLIAFITYNTVSFLATNHQGFDLLWRIFVFGIVAGGAIVAIIGMLIIVTIGEGKTVVEAVVLVGVVLLIIGALIGGAIIVVGVAVVGMIVIAGLVGAGGTVIMVRGVGVVSGVISGATGGVVSLIFIFAISLIKIVFTFKNIFDGLKQIPYNWNKLIVYQDMYSQPEIIPGINKFNGVNNFKFMHFKSSIIDSKQVIKNRIRNALLLVMLYAPTIIYRISLKSTSLFYWILFIDPFRINKIYDNERMKEIITKEQKVYLWFPVIMISIFLSLNIGFDAIDSSVKHIKGMPFYPYIKHFLSYFIFSSIVCGLMWLIAQMFLIGDKDSSEGFPRMLLNGLFKLLKVSVSIAIMLYMYHLYNLLNLSDVIKTVF